MEQKIDDTIMSKAFYKAEIRYDNNDSTTSEQTLYVYCDNTSDFEYVMNEKGQTVDCGGTDSLMTVLGKVMALEEYYGPGTERVKITRLENGSADLPQAVRVRLFGHRDGESKPAFNQMTLFLRDEVRQAVFEWMSRFDAASERDVWQAVRYWAEDWTRLLEGYEKWHQMKAGDRVVCDIASEKGRTGVVTSLGFSRSHGYIADVKMDSDGSIYVLNVKHLEVVKKEQEV